MNSQYTHLRKGPSWLSRLGLFTLLLLGHSVALAQTNPQNPHRGFFPAGSYSLGEIETINTVSGNLSLQIPLGALPPGRAGLSGKLYLTYNGKLYDSSLGWFQENGNWYSETLLQTSSEGGWRYSYQYQLQYESRPVDPNQFYCQTEESRFRHKIKMSFPDGSLHTFHLYGYREIDGYSEINPEGQVVNCPGYTPPPLPVGSQTYFTTDGTHLRLVLQHDSDTNYTNNPWTLYLPDGGKVTGGGAANQGIYDRNGNYIEIQNYVDPVTEREVSKLVDQFGREVIIDRSTGPNQDSIIHRGFNNEQAVTLVKWQNINISNPIGYDSQTSNGTQHYNALPSLLSGVEQVILPAQAGGLSYSFGYDTINSGGLTGSGALAAVTTPTGAQVAYAWGDGTSSVSYYWYDLLAIYPRQKTLTYQSEYDGIPTAIPPEITRYSKILGYSETTQPDGGVRREWYADAQHGTVVFGQLVHKEENPDGTLIERIWQQNIPNVPHWTPPASFGESVNPAVQAEFRTVKDGAGSLTNAKTAIKTFKYDKNGNVTQTTEYDWVDYITIPRDGSGKPLVPGGLTPKRVTVNTYYSATPDSQDRTTTLPAANANTYCTPDSPNLKRAIESSELRSDVSASTQLTRTEYFYDNPTTKGNLTEQRSWDSTKPGVFNRPLNAGTYISVTNLYDAHGNPTLTTDANGVQTELTYDMNKLYVIEKIVAKNTAVQRRMTFVNDSYSGLVTQDTDADNNVTTQTTYDVFGRPTLVEEAVGTARARKTVTEYSDTARRVIVRKDQDNVGDGKLISIEHYDQLGRVRLMRQLESGNPAEATDETKGVKIQTRYFAGTTGTPNSYELVSAPYRADKSINAGCEPGMAWKRTKYDQGGRLREVETFMGSDLSCTNITLPSPWGSNTLSTGKVVTEYDTEFTTVTDQAQKKRRSQVDGLGRLVRVDEPDANGNLGTTGAPAQPTDYSYNALGNLIQTSQSGVPVGGTSSVTQTRTFVYSSLARLLQANSPESGTISYEYDNNGNLKKKTDARGASFAVSYEYDELNRNTTVDYANTPTINPDISRVYDNPDSNAFGKGKLWFDYAGGDFDNGQTVEHKVINSYDELGRPLSVSRHFKRNGSWNPAHVFNTAQTYDLADHVKTKTYPSGHVANYSYDVDGDLISFSGNLGSTTITPPLRTYSDSLLYNAQGQMISERLGMDAPNAPLYHRRHYNARGQLFDVRLGTDSSTINDGINPNLWTGTSWNRGALRFYYSSNNVEYTRPAIAPQNNNGNLYRQDIFVPATLDGSGNVATWTMGVDYYSYDALNRLTRVDELPVASWVGGGNIGWLPQAYSQCYKYDRFGNRMLDTVATWGIGVNRKAFTMEMVTVQGQPTTSNRLKPPTGQSGVMDYDAAGNLTNDTYTGGGTRTYDAENRMLMAMDSNGFTSSSYVYDADGRRTRRSLQNGGDVWWQVYGIGGELVAEYQLSGSTARLKKEYGYRNGQLLVIADALNNNCQWLVTDQLGTPRMLVDQTGSLAGMKRRDYLPFGEELSAGMGHRQTGNGYTPTVEPRQQFTSKERDAETGLDYFEARYYSSVLGRFTSPDEFTGGPDELYDFAGVASDNPTFYAELDEPQSLNKYQYCYNNPLTNIDPDGHSIVSKIIKVVVKAAKTGDATAGLADTIQDIATVFNPAAPTLSRLGAAASVVSELSPVSVGDVKDAVSVIKSVRRHLEKVDDAGKNAIDLGARAKEIHSALPARTQRSTTTSLVETVNKEGKTTILVSSSEKNLRQAQRAALKPGEVAVSGRGHGETTGMGAAKRRKEKVLRVAASRPICDNCRDEIISIGAQPASPLKHPRRRPE